MHCNVKYFVCMDENDKRCTFPILPVICLAVLSIIYFSLFPLLFHFSVSLSFTTLSISLSLSHTSHTHYSLSVIIIRVTIHNTRYYCIRTGSWFAVVFCKQIFFCEYELQNVLVVHALPQTSSKNLKHALAYYINKEIYTISFFDFEY